MVDLGFLGFTVDVWAECSYEQRISWKQLAQCNFLTSQPKNLYASLVQKSVILISLLLITGYPQFRT